MRGTKKRAVGVSFTLDDIADQIRSILGGDQIAYTVFSKRSFLAAGEGIISQIGVYRIGKLLQIYLYSKPGQSGGQVVIGCPLDRARMELAESDLFPGNPSIILHFDRGYALKIDAANSLGTYRLTSPDRGPEPQPPSQAARGFFRSRLGLLETTARA